MTANLAEIERKAYMMRTADTMEMEAGGQSLEYGFFESVAMGTAGAAFSAWAGLANTGTAIGETLGIVQDDTYYFDTRAQLNTMFGKRTADFYTEHKVGLDVLGLIAGSIIPGTAAVRGLRALQVKGVVWNPMQVSTGLRNPDFIMSSPLLQKAKMEVLESGVPKPIMSDATVSLYRSAAKQQIMENIAFEVGVVATMNQHSTLNPDQLNYAEASVDQFFTGLPFMALGAAIGTGIDVLRAGGAIKRFVKEDRARVNAISTRMQVDLTRLNPGDQLVRLGGEAKELNEIAQWVSPDDFSANKALDERRRMIRTDIMSAITQANAAGEVGREALEKLVNGTQGAELESLASTLAALQKDGVRNITKEEFGSMVAFYERSRAPQVLVDIPTTANETFSQSLQDAFSKKGKQVRSHLAKVFKTDIFTREQLNTLNNVKLDFGNLDKDDSVLGRATTHFTDRYIKVDIDKTTGDATLMVHRGAVVVTGKMLEENHTLTNILRQDLGLPTVGFEEYKKYIYLHELAHYKSNKGGFTNKFAKFGEDLYGSDKKNTQRAVAVEALYGTYMMRGDLMLNELKNDVKALYNGKYPGMHIGSSEIDMFNAWKQALRTAKTEAEKKQLLEAFVDMAHHGKMDTTATQWFGGGWYTMAGSEYWSRIDELLADSIAMLTHPAYRSDAARHMPNLANMLNKYGGLEKAWSDTKAYMNVRTGNIHASYLPGVADMAGKDGVKIVSQGIDKSVVVPALNRTYKVNSEIWKKLRGEYANAVAKGARQDFMEYDAQYVYFAGVDIPKEFLSANTGEVVVNSANLALLERLATQQSPVLDELFKNQKVYIQFENNKRSLAPDREFVMKKLIQYKKEYRDALLATNRYNEQEIARMLNIDPDRAIGLDAPEGWTVMDKWDLRKPQIVSLNYEKVKLADAEANVKTMVAVNHRQSIIDALRAKVSASILGTIDGLMPRVELSSLALLTPVDETAGMLKNLRPEFESVRVQLAEIGRLTENLKQQSVQETANTYAQFSQIFNRRDAAELRYQLAQTENLLHRAWYYLVKTPGKEGSHYLVRKDAIERALAEMGDGESGIALSEFRVMLESDPELAADFIGSVIGKGEKFAPDAVKIPPELGTFYTGLRARNNQYIERDKLLASARGATVVRDPEVIYAPPRDLRRYKHIAFVVPNATTAGSDPRKFMIFAETEAELVAKRGVIKQKYGNAYTVLSKGETEEFKKYVEEYEKDLVFDEIYFDPTLARRGIASELIPSIDIQVSGTLERFQSWEINKKFAQIAGAVEAKYADQVYYLRSMDRIEGAPDREMMYKKFSGQSNIYKDSLALMLGKRATSGAIEDTWVRVNDFIGEKGSQIIDSAFGIFRSSLSEAVTESQLKQFNDRLEQAGYKAPLLDVMETVLTSPDPQVSRALPSLVRTMNNLAGTMMLRMDWAHSIVTTISSPILALPVLMEAKRALSGTPYGQRLKDMTTVINPATGQAEPTAAKLMLRATKAFFSKEGKEFMQELRARGIVTDYLSQYNQVMDFSQLNGRHTMKQVNDKIDTMAKFGARFSGFTFTEEFTRFIVAWSAKEIGEVRGLRGNELMSVVSSSVDKVHGIYIGHQRPQLFQGVVGQAIGMYQTYFFNFMQTMMRFVGDGNKRSAAAMAALQGSIFGIQSFPGFTTFNQMIGETNKDNVDIYEATDANDPKSMGAYMMYGLGSHALGFPIDFFSRGDLAIRNALIVPNPLNPMEIPAVSIIAKAVGNAINVVSSIADNPSSTGAALVHGLAHNGMNRPMQGLGTILQNKVTSNAGQVYFNNANYVDYSMMEEINVGGMFARLLGTRALDEAILLDAYYRKAAYQASARAQIEEIGTQVQLAMRSGTVTGQQYAEFAHAYENAGGDMQNFNAYMGRQFQQASSGSIKVFRDEMARDSELSRAYRRMEAERSAIPPWELD